MPACANPECDAETLGAGVCFTCANSDYKPQLAGVEYDGIVTPGHHHLRTNDRRTGPR